MSHEIEYSKKAFKAHSETYNTDVYFAFITTASNNVDPRILHPTLVGIGQSWEIIQKVCVLASECESGCLQPGGRRCSPETYIRRWRQVLKDAQPLETLKYLRLKLTMKAGKLREYLDKDNMPTDSTDMYRWDRIRELLGERPWSVHKWFDEEHVCVEFPVESYKDIELTVELGNHLKEVSLLTWNIQIEGV